MRAFALLTLFSVTLCGLVACGGNKAGNAANNAAQSAASAAGNAAGSAAGAMGNALKGAVNPAESKPNCGAVQAVWVNLRTKVYHEPGDPSYGKTKHGEYLCLSQAKAPGFRPSGGGPMKRHR